MTAAPSSFDDQDQRPALARVTVLVADIDGSTALIRDLDPEDAASLIDPALRIMIDAVERFDGVVSHRGDGIMAIFGTPSIAEDHTVRACLAALTICDTLAGGGARAGMHTPETRAHEVRVRIGIHVGDIMFRPVRIGGTWTQDAVGITVHVAARLEQTTESGTICLSRAAVDAANGFIRTRALGPIAVKGVDMPIERFELIEAERSANRWGVRAARGLCTFVDRVEERALLGAALAETGLRAVLIHGGAGLGKSRLLHEFLTTHGALACHTITFVGDHHRRSVPFHPIASCLRNWLDIRATDDPDLVRQKLTSRFAGREGIDGLGVEAVTRILDLAFPGSDIGAQKTQAPIDFGTPIATLIRLLAGGRRLILVCEDADYFDPATRDAIDAVLQRLATDDVLLVSASRVPVQFTTVPQWRSRSIALGPLADDDASVLLAQLDFRFGSQPALVKAIVRKAGGNPLFIEEVAPLAANQNAPEGLDAPLPDIPDRVEALIADRLARLPTALSQLVELAAVIGIEVPTALLAALAAGEPSKVHGALAVLQEEQILYESRRYPEAVFSFKHALIRDVIYRKMPAARRRTHHARIVELLEAGGSRARARSIDDLCIHALHARLWERAVGYLRQAARQAMARSAYRSALEALSRARSVAADHLPDNEETARSRLRLLTDLQVLIQMSGQYSDVLAVMDEAEMLAQRLADHSALARIRAGRVHVLSVVGRLDEAIALGAQIHASALAEGDHHQATRARFFIGQTQFNAGRLRDAEQTLSGSIAETGEAEPASGHAGSTLHGALTVLLPQVLGTRAMVRACLASFAAAETDAKAAITAATGAAPYERIFAAAAQGFVALHCRWHAATDHFRHALTLSDEAEITQLRLPALAGLGHALLIAGDAGAASETLSGALRLARAEQRPMFGLFAATGLALSSLFRGQPDLASGFADEAVGVAERNGYAGFRVHALRVQGLALAVTSGRERAGHTRIRASIGAATELGMLAEIAHGHAALACADAPDAAKHFDTAMRRYAALGLTSWAARVRADIAADRMPYL